MMLWREKRKKDKEIEKNEEKEKESERKEGKKKELQSCSEQ